MCRYCHNSRIPPPSPLPTPPQGPSPPPYPPLTSGWYQNSPHVWQTTHSHLQKRPTHALMYMPLTYAHTHALMYAHVTGTLNSVTTCTYTATPSRTYSQKGRVQDEDMLTKRQDNGPQQPGVPCGGHHEQTLIFTQTMRKIQGQGSLWYLFSLTC